MRTGADYLPRRASDLVLEALEDTRIVVVNGARQVGKSTLAQAVRRARHGLARFLDQPATREAAEADPMRFLQADGLMLIDEVQRVPDLWLAMKYLVDQDPRPGRFLLTGSARLLALKDLPDALPGRTETIELWPLSQGEIDETPDRFIDAVFALGADLRTPTLGLRRKDYVDRAMRGGYPEVVRRQTPNRRDRFFASYISDLIVRDVKQVADIDRVDDLRRLMTLLGGRMAGLLSANNLAGDLSISAPTVRNHLAILETVFLIKFIPGWTASVGARAVSAPKVIFVDSGLGAYLGKGEREPGGLLENFVLAELARQLTWSEELGIELYHYRDRDQNEVDAVLENRAGEVICVEVKASETVRTDDFRAMRLLRNRMGGKYKAGVVLYCGNECLPFGDKMVALPISALWTSVPT